MENKTMLSTPIAIIIAGVIIAGAVLYTGKSGGQVAAPNLPTFKAEALRPLAETDHIRGDLATAKVVIMEYSDLECPFCKRFHETMNEVTKKYGGDVAWVYRHLPLPMHSKALKEAEAAECAAKLGGDAKFWEYTDEVFAITPSNDGLDLAELPKIATNIGLDETAFTTCLASGEMVAKIQADAENAAAAGGQGTPFSMMVTKEGTKELGGAVPLEQLTPIIEAELK